MSAVSSTIQREELQISVMLISVVVVFFICQVRHQLICHGKFSTAHSGNSHS